MTLTPFASVADIEARWRELSTSERTKATALLSDATALLLANGVVPDISDAIKSALLKSITCNMVIRSMPVGDNFNFGVSQYSQTVGAVSESFTMPNPTGDLYLTRAEKKALGISGSKVWVSVPPQLKGACDES